jgi:drug/metabolite transporter (DMT)-like permease
MTMNLNLKINSVATYQLSKIAILPSIVLAKRKRLSVRETIGVLMATTGVYFATVRDPTIEMDGIYIAVVAVLTNVVSIMIGERVKSKGFGAVQVMRKEMPLSTILLMLTIPFTEESVSVVINEMTSYVMIVIVCTCICAAMINSTAFMMITRIGSISYLMCGHAKTLLVLSMGLVARAYGGTENDNDSVVGFWSLFAFCGVVIYSWNGATTSSNKKDE